MDATKSYPPFISLYTTPCWKCGSENVEESSLTKFRIHPHRNTHTGDEAMMTWE